MDFLPLALSLLIVPVLLIGFRWFAASRLLLSLRFRANSIVPISLENLPQYINEGFNHTQSIYLLEGFRARQAFRHEGFLGEPFDETLLELTDDTQTLRLHLRPYPQALLAGRFYPELNTTLSNGHELVTTSFLDKDLLDPAQALLIEEHQDYYFKELLARHKQRLEALEASGIHALALEPNTALVRAMDLQEAQWQEMNRDTDHFQSIDPSSLRFRLAYVLQRSFRLLWRSSSDDALVKKLLRNPALAKPLLAATQIEFDLKVFNRLEKLRTSKLSQAGKLILLLVSLGLLFLSLGLDLTPTSVLITLAVIVLHEGGHLLGMWFFGCRDTQLLFIPFLGAVASHAGSDRLLPWKRIVIVFLGPLPGLFLGFLAWATWQHPPAWGHTLIVSAIFINAFNLLPLLPLDGGQVLRHALVSRWPRAEVLFQLMSSLLLIALGVYAGLHSLVVLGVLLILPLQIKWRQATLVSDFRLEISPDTERLQATRIILKELRQPNHDHTPWLKRLASVPSLLAEVLVPKAGLLTLLFSFVAYLSPLWLGLPMVVLARHLAQKQELNRIEQTARSQDILPIPAPAVEFVSEGKNGWEQLSLLTRLRLQDADAFNDPHSPSRIRESGASEREMDLLTASHSLAQQTAITAPDYLQPGDPALSSATRTLVILSQLCEAQTQYLLKTGNNTEAFRTACDMLRMSRALRADLRLWNWQSDLRLNQHAWLTIQECLNKSQPCTSAEAQQLETLCDELSLITFARRSIHLNELLEQIQLNQPGVPERNGESTTPPTKQSLATALSKQGLALEDLEQTIQEAITTRDFLSPLLQQTPLQIDLAGLNEAPALGRIHLQELLIEVAVLRKMKLTLHLKAEFEIPGKTLPSLYDKELLPAANPIDGQALMFMQSGSDLLLNFPEVTKGLLVEETSDRSHEVVERAHNRKDGLQLLLSPCRLRLQKIR